MNPLAWKQCALALAAMAILAFATGCGSSNGIITSIGGSFSDASLNGQFVITQTGIGINQQFSEIIIFKADGNRNLNVMVDDLDQLTGTTSLSAPVSGSYTIGGDGVGSLSFNGSHFAIAMIDTSHFYVIEQDVFATASGFGEKQDTTAFSAAPSGPFVFKAHNVNTSSRVGRVVITNGALSGTEDLLTLGFLSSSKAVASAVAMNTPDTNGVGTFTLSDGTSFNYYVVNPGKFDFISNSPTSASLEIGQAEGQTGGPFSEATLAPGTSYVFGSSGDTSFQAGIHSAGVFTADGNGNITAGGVDFVQDQTVNSNLTVPSGTYTLDTDGHGRLTLNSSGATINPQVFWMVNGTSAVFLVDSTAAVEDGSFTLQQGAPFSSLGNQAAFFMDGFDTAFKDRVGAFTPITSGFTWKQESNSFDPINGGTLLATVTNGTEQVGSNGRVTASVSGVTTSVVFYLSSPGTGFMVQEDTNVQGQVNNIGGAFTQQVSP